MIGKHVYDQEKPRTGKITRLNIFNGTILVKWHGGEYEWINFFQLDEQENGSYRLKNAA